MAGDAPVWDAAVVERSLSTLSVSNSQWVARLKNRIDDLREVATHISQPMCVIYDNQGKSCESNGRGFSETMEVRCVQKWESANVCMTVFKSGKVKIVGVKSRDKALFVLKTFVSALRKVKGFHDASLDINEGFTLVMVKLDCSLGQSVSQTEIKRHLPANSVDFDPERYHGLKVQWAGMKIIVFSTGTMMIVPVMSAVNRVELSQDPMLYVRKELQPFLQFVVQIMHAKMSVSDCAYVVPKRQRL